MGGCSQSRRKTPQRFDSIVPTETSLAQGQPDQVIRRSALGSKEYVVPVTDDELAALEHENWIAYLTGVASCTARTTVIRAGGLVTLLTGLPMDWFNQILIEGEHATRAAVLDAVTQARERSTDFVVRLRQGVDDRFIPTLIQAGLEAAGDEVATPGMVAFPIDHGALAKQVAPSLEIRRVTDTAGIDAHRQAATDGFGGDPAVALGTVCTDLLGRPECAIYVGFVDGHPVVSGLGWRTGRTIGVYSIATVPSARRRGYGAAMTARVVADGALASCDVAALQASELGRPIYERLGFRTVLKYDAYATPLVRNSEAKARPSQTLGELAAQEPEDWMAFAGELHYWRGPSPYHFIRVPGDVCVGLRALSTVVSYGWGVIPVTGRIGSTVWETSLFPKDDGYVVPIKDAVRKAQGLALGDTVTVELSIRV
jgi:GNAT superfamily N-acetyltransferase